MAIVGRSLADSRDRLRRVVNVASKLAAEGGPDAVQMRVVAELADVSLATLYKLAPSKLELLQYVLVDQIAALELHNQRVPVVGVTRGERVAHTLFRAFAGIRYQPELGRALFTVFAGVSPATESIAKPGTSQVPSGFTGVLIRAASQDGIALTGQQEQMVEIASLVWNSVVGLWLSGLKDTPECKALIKAASLLVDGLPDSLEHAETGSPHSAVSSV